MIESQDVQKNTYSRNYVLAIITTTIFLILCILGEGLGGSLGSNPMCYKYLGCTEGFFGYDAIEHLFFGISAVWIISWIFQKYPKYSLLHGKRWKNVLTIIALIMLVSVAWEFFECAMDSFKVDILHQTLVDWKLHINLLNQPTNIDTMGDLTFSLLGSTASLLFIKIW